jgi:hypothetical protein
MNMTCPPAASRADANAPVRSGLRRWFALALEAHRQHLQSRDAIELELLARTHLARAGELPRTPESLRDAYRLFSGGDPLRLL